MHLFSVKRLKEDLTEDKHSLSYRTKFILPHVADIHFDFHHVEHDVNNFISDSAQVKKKLLYDLF